MDKKSWISRLRRKNMKKAPLLLFLPLLVALALPSCSSSDYGGEDGDAVVEEKIYHTCDISFSEDKAGEHPIKTSEFLVDTDIYVTVNFSFFNLDDVEDVIKFEVNLKPGFDTYSVVDYTEGPQKPKDAPTECDYIDENNIQKVIAITGMQFPIHSGIQKKSYKYVFTLRASKSSDSCFFKAVFSAQDGQFSSNRPNWSKQENFVIVNNEEEVVI